MGALDPVGEGLQPASTPQMLKERTPKVKHSLYDFDQSSIALNRLGQSDDAGVLGFEPRNGETKTRCLTAWRHPNVHTYIS